LINPPDTDTGADGHTSQPPEEPLRSPSR